MKKIGDDSSSARIGRGVLIGFGVLTADGGLICGDLSYNDPGFGFGLVDDLAQHRANVNRLKGLNIRMVYPGHGRPCPVGRIIHN